MNEQHNQTSWRILADRFIWSDENALPLIPEEISDEELQKYLYTYHKDKISIEEIKTLRAKDVKDQ
ncbi:hypothetical protein EPA93_23680 [Ktedonosporobacter rubrisoli]|uniref:Uncharacterized protein n=1 Tax=Ktedonosporobacter rubrisoli TaxID=2509675 RepID=A0A4V0YZ83_KTERU|nr:hypothetical protein [Ktedonosporobacter rubrisoli]QBD78821.1 hypothetical protein EPA93_23680 [Ktedonosporobacter rubrisoli]